MRNKMGFGFWVAAALLGAPPAALADGDCVVSVDDGVLIVEGDEADNNVSVIEIAPGVWEVVGNDGTTVNGLASDTFSDEIEDILVDLGDGDDLSDYSGEIPGDLTVLGGAGRNEFLLFASTVGGDVLVENEGSGETDFQEGTLIEGDLTIVNGEGFDESKISATEIGGDVSIDNDDGDPLTGASSVTDLEEGTFVGGDFVVENGEGFDALDIGEAEVAGDLVISNKDGNELTGEGSSTDVEAVIGGDLKVDNKTGSDEVEVEESEVGGDVTIKNQSGDSAVQVQDAVLGGSLLVDNKVGFDEIELSGTEVDGDVTLKTYNGGSEIVLGAEVSIGGDLLVDTRNGSDAITLEGLLVEGATAILTGPAADVLTVIASAFEEALTVDGGSGADTFADGGGNGFAGGIQLTSIGL
ncbi:MAG: hypothetical protein L0323_20820 [Planctomycetes bacterium]|nr:hypothetical protein [Planctomycetota bacterium]